MSNQLKVYIKNIGEYVAFEGGETLSGLFDRLSDRMPDMTPICALVNNKAEDLQYPLFAPKQVEFLSPRSEEGRRTYVHTLCMMLYRAVSELCPGTRLVIEHSVASGYYCRLIGEHVVTDALIDALKQRIGRLVDDNLPIVRKERLTADVVKIYQRQGLDDKVRLLKSLHELYTVYYTLDGVSDGFYGNLAPSTSMCPVFDLQRYKDGFLLLGPDPDNHLEVAQMTVQDKMFAAYTDYLAFNRVVGVDDAGSFNQTVEQRESPRLINVAEAMHSKRIGAIADEITRRFDDGGARVVLIAGPSSSGKTTFTKRLAIQLMTNLLEPCMVSLDDYFVNRVNTPRDETGDYDYESLYALDLDTFNRDLNRLLEGEEVELPSYNFELGERVYKGNRLRMGERSVLLIEGIHGLNPELTAHIADKQKYRVYVSALTTISIDDHNWVPTTDNRLLRRIVRDYKYRGVSAEDTIRRWPSVRRGENRWIFPYQENADAMFNSSLIFELGVIRDYAEQILRGVRRDTEEYAVAYRLRALLGFFDAIPERFIPSTSLLREFLGGSSFHY